MDLLHVSKVLFIIIIIIITIILTISLLASY
jgi:hypothetical protein